MAAAILLRAWNLQDQSIWYDDYNCAGYLGCDRFRDYMVIIRHQNPEAVPLYYIFVYLWAQVFGASGMVARWFSVLLHGVAAWVLFRAGSRLAGRSAGLVASLWFACSPWQVWHGQSVRPYPLVALLSALLLWMMIHAVHTGSRRAGWAAVLTVLVLPWVHLTSLVVLPPLMLGLVWVLWRGGRIPVRDMLLIIPLAAAVWIPLVYWILHLPIVSAGAYSMYHPPDAVRSLFALLAPDAPQRMGEVVAGFPESWDPFLPVLVFLRDALEWILAAIGLIALTATGYRMFRMVNHFGEGNSAPAWSGLAFVWLIAVLPPVVLVLLSYAWRPCFMPRYLMASAPALYLLIGAFFARPGRWSRPAAGLVLMFPLVLTGITCLASVTRADWLGAAGTLWADARDGDLILSAASLGAPTLEYHLADRYRSTALPAEQPFRIFRERRAIYGPGWVYESSLKGHSVRFGITLSPLQATEIGAAYLEKNPNARIWIAWTEEPYGPPLFEQFASCARSRFATVHDRRFRGQFAVRLIRAEHPLGTAQSQEPQAGCAVSEEDARNFWEQAAGNEGALLTTDTVPVLRRILPAPLPADLISLVGVSSILAAAGFAVPARTLAETAASRFPDTPESELIRGVVAALTGEDCTVVDRAWDRIAERSAFYGLFGKAVRARCRGDMETFARESARLDYMGIPLQF